VKRMLTVLTAVLVLAATLGVMALPAMAQSSQEQSWSGKYICYGPFVTVDGFEMRQLYGPLSKKEAEEGLASGAYVGCDDKILPNQAR
jgi:hypothetical protein